MEPMLDTYLNLLYIMMTLYLYPCVHNFVWVAISIVTRTFAYWYICALVLPSHSFSILDHILCAYGYTEVFVVVTGCNVQCVCEVYSRG